MHSPELKNGISTSFNVVLISRKNFQEERPPNLSNVVTDNIRSSVIGWLLRKMDENENKFRELKSENDGWKLKFFRHTCQPWGNPWTIGWKLSHSYHNLVSSIRGIIKPKTQYYNTGSQKSNTGWELKKINENENEISKVKVWKWNSSTFQKPEISCHIGRIGRENARTIDLETPLSLGKCILMPTIS